MAENSEWDGNIITIRRPEKEDLTALAVLYTPFWGEPADLAAMSRASILSPHHP